MLARELQAYRCWRNANVRHPNLWLPGVANKAVEPRRSAPGCSCRGAQARACGSHTARLESLLAGLAPFPLAGTPVIVITLGSDD
jgi:hypothetical protein